MALALGACGATRAAVTLTPAGVTFVPASALPKDFTDWRRPGDALRIDYYASPELLMEDVSHMLDEVWFCGELSSMALDNITGGPFLGRFAIRRDVPRQKVRAAWAQTNAGQRPVYSTYVLLSRIYIPTTTEMPARPAFDLRREPKALCLKLSLRDGYEFARTTNTLTVSAEQIAAAVR
jgi:hypothetical protein